MRTYKALVEMSLNDRIVNFIKVILNPTDGRHVILLSPVLSGQIITRKRRQRQELTWLRTRLRLAQVGYVVLGDSNDGRWRRRDS